MKLNGIKVSKMVYYYYDENQINNLINVLGEPDSIIFVDDNIILSIKNNDDIYYMLRNILQKSSKITNGDSYAYEYELGLNEPSQDDIYFTISTDYCSYKSELIHINYNSNNIIEITFKKK